MRAVGPTRYLVLSSVVVVFTSCPILFCLYCGRNHKEDVKAVLQSEAGLVEEIDYDLRRFQKEEQERRQKAKVRLASPCLHVYGDGGQVCYEHDDVGDWSCGASIRLLAFHILISVQGPPVWRC